MNKQDIEKQEEQGLIALVDQSGVELAMDKLMGKNNSLLPSNVAVERIKNSAGFYISNREDLMALPQKEKLSMLYGVLKEAMVGCEAGVDYDIVPFKNKYYVVKNSEDFVSYITELTEVDINGDLINVKFTNVFGTNEEITKYMNNEKVSLNTYECDAVLKENLSFEYSKYYISDIKLVSKEMKEYNK